ncbi:hypothetical protein IIA79_01745, partial [bacterium]|nr:hypothetical protein [bacterium]
MNHTVTMHAPAKVNLGLEVLYRDAEREMHRIYTVMQAIDLYDELTVSVSGGDAIGAEGGPDGESGVQSPESGSPEPSPLNLEPSLGQDAPLLSVSGPFAHEAPVEGNTVLAAWAVMRGPAVFPPLEVKLVKRIPAGAGL